MLPNQIFSLCGSLFSTAYAFSGALYKLTLDELHELLAVSLHHSSAESLMAPDLYTLV